MFTQCLTYFDKASYTAECQLRKIGELIITLAITMTGVRYCQEYGITCSSFFLQIMHINMH